MTSTPITDRHRVVEHPSGYCMVETADGTVAAIFYPDSDDVGEGVRYIDPCSEGTTGFFRIGDAPGHAKRWAGMLDGFIADDLVGF